MILEHLAGGSSIPGMRPLIPNLVRAGLPLEKELSIRAPDSLYAV